MAAQDKQSNFSQATTRRWDFELHIFIVRGVLIHPLHYIDVHVSYFIPAWVCSQNMLLVFSGFRLELSTEQVQSGIEFSKVSCGRGTAVVIQSVQPGPLSEAGLVVGQRLVGISDPIQADQVN